MNNDSTNSEATENTVSGDASADAGLPTNEAQSEASTNDSAETTAAPEAEPVSSEAATETAQPDPATTTDQPTPTIDPAPVASNNITVKFAGVKSGTAEVASGSTVKQAMKAAGITGSLMLRDANNSVVGESRKLTADMTITTVAQGRGG
jgi:hypothetical protein